MTCGSDTVVGASFRDKCAELLEYSSNENLPLLIFSAGLANVLKEFLTMRGVYHPNIHVVSNLMDFDENGDLRAFEGELIHTMNKNATVLKKVAAGWAHDEKRKNILLVRPPFQSLLSVLGLLCPDACFGQTCSSVTTWAIFTCRTDLNALRSFPLDSSTTASMSDWRSTRRPLTWSSSTTAACSSPLISSCRSALTSPNNNDKDLMPPFFKSLPQRTSIPRPCDPISSQLSQVEKRH